MNPGRDTPSHHATTSDSEINRSAHLHEDFLYEDEMVEEVCGEAVLEQAHLGPRVEVVAAA